MTASVTLLTKIRDHEEAIGDFEKDENEIIKRLKDAFKKYEEDVLDGMSVQLARGAVADKEMNYISRLALGKFKGSVPKSRNVYEYFFGTRNNGTVSDLSTKVQEPQTVGQIARLGRFVAYEMQNLQQVHDDRRAQIAAGQVRSLPGGAMLGAQTLAGGSQFARLQEGAGSPGPDRQSHALGCVV